MVSRQFWSWVSQICSNKTRDGFSDRMKYYFDAFVGGNAKKSVLFLSNE
jgi:hypothetical protein